MFLVKAAVSRLKCSPSRKKLPSRWVCGKSSRECPPLPESVALLRKVECGYEWMDDTDVSQFVARYEYSPCGPVYLPLAVARLLRTPLHSATRRDLLVLWCNTFLVSDLRSGCAGSYPLLEHLASSNDESGTASPTANEVHLGHLGAPYPLCCVTSMLPMPFPVQLAVIALSPPSVGELVMESDLKNASCSERLFQPASRALQRLRAVISNEAFESQIHFPAAHELLVRCMRRYPFDVTAPDAAADCRRVLSVLCRVYSVRSRALEFHAVHETMLCSIEGVSKCMSSRYWLLLVGCCLDAGLEGSHASDCWELLLGHLSTSLLIMSRSEYAEKMWLLGCKAALCLDSGGGAHERLLALYDTFRRKGRARQLDKNAMNQLVRLVGGAVYAGCSDATLRSLVVRVTTILTHGTDRVFWLMDASSMLLGYLCQSKNTRDSKRECGLLVHEWLESRVGALGSGFDTTKISHIRRSLEDT